MKNKLWGIILMSCFCNTFVLADSYNMKNDFTNDVISENKIKINYTIKLYKNELLVYSGNIDLKNSMITPIFFGETTEKNEKKLEAIQSLQEKTIAKKEEVDTERSQFQLRVAVHIDKEKKNMWSHFFLQEIKINNNNKASLLQKDKNTFINAEDNPENFKLEKEIIISHKNNKEVIYSWNEYKFIIIGDY